MISTDQLINYTLHLADTTLITAHRNSEWCGHGPVLEQDIAITNISLDLIGQARNFYQYAATLMGGSATEDSLAYLRDANEFKNLLLAEQPRGDWAYTILRQFFFSAYQHELYQRLQESPDEQLAAIATKAMKEVIYHLRWSSEWVIRLGDGTEESSRRLKAALAEMWSYTNELFSPVDYEVALTAAGICPDIISLKDEWNKKVREIFERAHLDYPNEPLMHSGGKEGKHTPHLEELLNEMQMMQRKYPGVEW